MITLNAWQCGWRENGSATWGAKPQHVQWVYDRTDFDGVTIFEDAAMWADGALNVRSTRRVGWLHEPRALHPHYYDQAVDVRAQYDCILTHDASLLNDYPDKFRFTIHGGVSIPSEYWGMHLKRKNVMMLCSDRDTTPNHLLRQQIATSIKGIDVYRDLYGAAKIEAVKPYRFMIVVENSSEPNWFTEHVLDAIALGCVPIYYYPQDAARAVRSLGWYIDLSGLWLFDSLEYLAQIMRQIQARGSDWYEEFADSVQANQNRIAPLAVTEDWFVQNAIGDLCCQR